MIYNVTLKLLWKSMQFLLNIHSIAFLIIMGINSVFIYIQWYLKRSNTIINTNSNTEKVIY